jgi:Xaa-Pro aminopeptidase
MLRTSGIDQGIVQVYGQVDIGRTYTVLRFLESSNPELHFTGFERGDLIKKAMMRKEATEIDRMRRVGAISVDVVGNVADYLTSCKVEHGKLINEEGEWLTIGAVKRMINLWLAEQGLENPHGSIFAMGRDAGIPHSTGTDTDVLQLGQTIVFDFYPCEPGGGYFHDFTRTWCLGYASDEILRLYEDVLSVYDQIVKSLAVGSLFKEYQQRTCDLFQGLGHTTIQSDPACMEGYVHSVGHGVGLNIHEMPFAGINATEDEKLVPGTVFTVEPGLYYPSKGMGVRIEDTFYTSDDGLIDVLAEYPKDLILPMKG